MRSAVNSSHSFTALCRSNTGLHAVKSCVLHWSHTTAHMVFELVEETEKNKTISAGTFAHRIQIISMPRSQKHKTTIQNINCSQQPYQVQGLLLTLDFNSKFTIFFAFCTITVPLIYLSDTSVESCLNQGAEES